FSFNGQLSLGINNTGAAVNEEFSIPGQGVVFSEPGFGAASSLPTTNAAAVALPSAWVTLFQNHGITLGASPTVKGLPLAAAGKPSVWQVQDGATKYLIEKMAADPQANPATDDRLEVRHPLALVLPAGQGGAPYIRLRGAPISMTLHVGAINVQVSGEFQFEQ